MKLHELKPNRGAKHRKKRLGCGESSGLGKTSGAVTRDRSPAPVAESARASRVARCPFTGACRRRDSTTPVPGPTIAIVNLAQLNAKFEDGDTVNEESPSRRGPGQGRNDAIKVLGHGDNWNGS